MTENAVPKRKVPLLPKIHSLESKDGTQTATNADPSRTDETPANDGDYKWHSPVFVTNFL